MKNNGKINKNLCQAFRMSVSILHIISGGIAAMSNDESVVTQNILA